MVIDPTTNVGKVRLRIGDWSDLPILPDTVITQALTDNNNNVYRAASLCAQYILATLSFKTHSRLDKLETWGSEAFNNYVKFLQTTVLNPTLSEIAPIPYSGSADDDGQIKRFIQDWKAGYITGSVVIPPQTPGSVIEYEY